MIGIDGRNTEDNVLLADPKAYWELGNQVPKILAQHSAYGRAMIVVKVGGGWQSVIWNEPRSTRTREFGFMGRCEAVVIGRRRTAKLHKN